MNGEGRGSRTTMPVMIAIFVLITTVCSTSGADEGNDTVSLTHSGLQPRSGGDGTMFLFTIRVTASEPPSDPMEVVINDRPYTMREVDPDDTDLSDGKDFYHRQRLSSGGVIYFYRSGNTTTASRSLTVGDSGRLNYHYDVSLAMGLMVIPVMLGIMMLRRIENEFREITRFIRSLDVGEMRATRGAGSGEDTVQP